MLGRRIGRAKSFKHLQRDERGRHAAERHLAHHAPVDQSVPRQTHSAAHFGERCKQQVGANGQVRLDAKDEDQQWRHQRAAAHACQAHDQADGKTGKYEGKLGEEFMHHGAM